MISFLYYYDFDRTTIGLFKNIFNKSFKKFVIPVIVGLRYIFYPRRCVMFTIDQTIQWELRHWYIIYTVTPTRFCTVIKTTK